MSHTISATEKFILRPCVPVRWIHTRVLVLHQLGLVYPGNMREDIRDYLHSQNGSTSSIADQIAVPHAMWEQDIGPSHDGLKTNEVEDELNLDLEFTVETSLGHLQDANIVESGAPPGPDTFVIASWMDDGDGEIVNGEVDEAAEEGIEALADDISSGPSPSSGAAATDGGGKVSLVADELDLVSNKMVEFLRTTDGKVNVLNKAVHAIQEADGVECKDDYGEIAFINPPHRHNLSEKAMALYAK